MIEINKTKVMNFEAAIRGMRNPKKSWDKQDSSMMYYGSGCEFWDSIAEPIGDAAFKFGDNDWSLAMGLAKAGSDHRKFMRQIFVSADIKAFWAFWREYVTYKIGTVENSTSQMHKIINRKLTEDDFGWSKITNYRREQLEHLNGLIKLYQNMKMQMDCVTKKIKKEELKKQMESVWRQIIENVPASFIYLRTVSLNYEVLRNMYQSRKSHKLKEWHKFCDWIEQLPYSELITAQN